MPCQAPPARLSSRSMHRSDGRQGWRRHWPTTRRAKVWKSVRTRCSLARQIVLCRACSPKGRWRSVQTSSPERPIRRISFCAIAEGDGAYHPVALVPEEVSDAGVIEVYAAATKIVVKRLSAAAALGLHDPQLRYANAHVEDALWCAVAALHFVRGECEPPTDLARRQREGWIWIRLRKATE